MLKIVLALMCVAVPGWANQTKTAGAVTDPAWGIADYELTPFSEIGLTLNGQGSMTGDTQRDWDLGNASYWDNSTSGSGLNFGLELNHEKICKAYDYSLIVPLNVEWKDEKKNTKSHSSGGGVSGYTEEESSVSSLNASLVLQPEFTWYPGMFQLGARPSVDGQIANDFSGTKKVERYEYFDGTPNDYTDIRDTDWRERQGLSAGLDVWAGLGRVESKVSAWRALELAAELRRRGCLARPLSPVDAQGLAGLLANAYSAFTWDAREMRFAQAMAITRFLEEHGYLTAETSAASLTVSEALDYGGGSRLKGWEAVAFGVTQKQWLNIKYEDRPAQSLDVDIWMYGVRGGYHAPFAEDWQFDVTGSVQKYDRAEKWQMVSTQAIAWYPDTRLSVSLSNSAGWATEHYAGAGYGGDLRQWFERGSLGFGWSMTHYVLVNLSGYLTYRRYDYINTYSNADVQSDAATSIRDLHDKNSYRDILDRGVNLSFTYRFF